MKLTDELKERIDKMDYTDLLKAWRFRPVGDDLFTGESGEYFQQRMQWMRKALGEKVHVLASKFIGWDK